MKLTAITLVLVLLCLPAWVRAAEGADGIVGELDFYRAIDGRCVLPRDVIVWTPPGYETDTERHYPVLYLHDGQNVFDPATSYIGAEWQADETVDRLVREGVIEPVIVVALTNTMMRDKEYSPGPRGRGYMELLVHTVKPMIDANYRTRPEKQHTLTAGSSMGGLISCMLGWQYPEVFGAVLCFSPAFKVEGQLDELHFFTHPDGEKRDVFFYVYNGGIGLENRLQPGIDEMLTYWENIGYRRGEDFVLAQNPEAEHNEKAWAEHLPIALVRGLEEASRR